MQSDINHSDITAINIQLNELRSKFDQAMHEGQHDFPHLKETYLQMKELECYINALQWDPENPTLMHQHTTSAHSWT
jgi:hypothetical protein